MKKINTKLSVRGCWEMVNRIQNGNSPEEIRRRCIIAEQWLTKNENISIDEFDSLMKTVAFLHRETYYDDNTTGTIR